MKHILCMGRVGAGPGLLEGGGTGCIWGGAGPPRAKPGLGLAHAKDMFHIWIYLCLYVYDILYYHILSSIFSYIKHILCMGRAHAKDMFHIWYFHM